MLVLEDGTLFLGRSVGSRGESVGEVVFNTSMTGYQEILTDPSYARQFVTLTSPHIGNVGVNADDDESRGVYAAGLVIRDLPLTLSNFRAEESLPSFLCRHGIAAISDINTRKLTRLLRDRGAMNGCLQAGAIDLDSALEKAQAFPGLKGMDLAREVTTTEPYAWHEGLWRLEGRKGLTPPKRCRVVAYDFGIKQNILIVVIFVIKMFLVNSLIHFLIEKPFFISNNINGFNVSKTSRHSFTVGFVELYNV